MRKILLFVAVIFLTVTALHAQLQFQPATLDFGQKPITSTSTLEVTLTSQINQLISLSDLPAPFSAAPDEFMIAIGEQKTVTITFHPMTVGSFGQTLTASGSIWGTAQLQVYGQAGEATVSFSTYSLDMGTIIMTGHSQQMITLQSEIAQQVTLSNLPSPFGYNPMVVDLLPNEPAQVFVSFDPITPGYFQDYLYATGNISGSAQIIVYGSATEASIFAFPQSVNFDPLFSGQTDTLELIVTTDINQQVTLSGLSEVFNITPTTLVLTGGNPETVFISFNPVNPGVFNETLQLQGDVWGSLQVPVYGECIDPQISASPGQVDFGTIALLTSSTQYVTVYNTGNGLLECELANNNPHFTVSPGVLSISQGSSQGVAITFIPDFVPVEYDTLLITSNDPDTPLVKIPLQGQGMSQVSGEVCGTWYKANSPYNFTGSVTVPETCTLTIEPGVVVNMGSNSFIINGRLNCKGLLNDSIVLNGWGYLQTSKKYCADTMQYISFRHPPEQSGLTIQSYGIVYLTCNFNCAYIYNSNTSWVTYSDFDNWSWNDKWSKTNPGNGDVYVTDEYYHYSPFMVVVASATGNDFGVISNPIIVTTPGKIKTQFEYRIPNSNSNSNTQWKWRVNHGQWNVFYETCYSCTYGWTSNESLLDYYFKVSDTLELMILNHANNSDYYYQRVDIENFKLLIDNHVINILSSKIKVLDINNYSTDCGLTAAARFQNTNFYLTGNIETFNNFSSIEIKNSIISHASDHAIKSNNSYSNIYLDSVTIENVAGNGVSTWSENSEIFINHSSIKNCSVTGVYSNSYYSPVVVENSFIENNGSAGIHTSQSYSGITVKNSVISNNTGSGIVSNSSYSPVFLINSEVSNNGGYGVKREAYEVMSEIYGSRISGNHYSGIYMPSNLRVKGSSIDNNSEFGIYSGQSVEISNSVISSNKSYGIYAHNITGFYLTSIYNALKGIVATGSETSYLFNSIIGLNGQSGLQYSGNIEFSYSKFNGDPKLADSLGHLLPNSPCVDAADPTEEDAQIPYGMGTIRADMGAYGGPENWVWGGEPIPTNGEPEIVHIVDLPQDQGKMVGIQYKASLFDNGHTAYDVTHYSFWRELDENGKMPLEASKTPVGQYFQKGTNYWEYVGEMPANGFANYGYSATTLGDSTVSGKFWSKFLVVAHTSDDNIYWVSQPDSGYSVDNLAPAQPLNLAGTVAGVTYNLQWTPSPDEDFQYYAVYRAEGGIFGEEPFATTTEPEFADITLNLEEQDFAVAAFDFSGNRSALSSPLTTPVYDMLTISEGWSGISSWIGPLNPSFEDLFASASTDLIILQNMNGVYWPGQNVNTLGSWDDGSGYMVKMAQEAQIPFIGTKNPEAIFQLTSGWQILPVLSGCPLSVNELQNQLGNNLLMVKEIAGWRVFWPAMGISTLETLEPGKAYFLNTLTGNGVVVFGECE